MNSGIYKRALQIESLNKTLNIFQKETGDVSCVVWDAALVLSKYLDVLSCKDEGWLHKLKVLELGSGLGCVGLTATCFGAYVTMTDLPEALENLQYNIDMNKSVWSLHGGHAQVKPLKWGQQNGLDMAPDVVLMADCVYYEESIEPLITTLLSITNNRTEVILSQEKRETDRQKSMWKKFLEELSRHFDYSPVPLNEQHPLFSSPDICLLHAKRKSFSLIKISNICNCN